jgi:hypothetical protein
MLLDEPFCSDHLRAIELRLLLASSTFEGSRSAVEEELDSIESGLAQRLADPCFDHPASWLRTRLGLSATEERAVWLLVACELSPKLRVLARSLATEQVCEPTIDVVRRVVYGGATAEACREIEPRGNVFRWRLLECEGSGPIAQRTVRLAARVVRLVHGDGEVDGEVAELCVRAETAPLGELSASAEALAAVTAAVSGAWSGVTVLVGGRGTGRCSLVEACARQIGRAALVVDMARADAEHVAAIAREAELLDRVLVLRDLDKTAQRAEVCAAIDREIVQRVRGPVFVTAAETLRLRWAKPVRTVEMAPLDSAQRTRVWQAAVPEAPVEVARVLAARHPLAPGLVHAAVRAARAQGGEIDHAAIAAGMRVAIDDGLAAYATRVETAQTWDDLVLPEDDLALISELVARASHRDHVYERWGFAAKVGRGLGVSALFSGPPGTGKTMVAGLIARELGLACYQVDLAKMVSKWIGETEKNLAALFDAAEAAHAVLLFDEADSLFGKRTQVTSANDRYANLEVNYLLQRMETFRGISILTSNHEKGIDEAFRRRLSLHLRFDLPDAAERERIWRAMVPASAEVADGVELRGLAARFAMSGGYIKNAVLRAAFLAAAEGTAIAQRHLEYAAHVEYEGMGKIAPRSAAA